MPILLPLIYVSSTLLGSGAIAYGISKIDAGNETYQTTSQTDYIYKTSYIDLSNSHNSSFTDNGTIMTKKQASQTATNEKGGSSTLSTLGLIGAITLIGYMVVKKK